MATSFRVLIPARYLSSRLPGKPLLKFQNKTIIEHVYDQACASEASSVHIATDDERIAEEAKRFGAQVCMTHSEHRSGTDRIAQAVTELGCDDDEIIVNLQGDEPQMPAVNIKQVAELLAANEHAAIATLYTKITDQHDYSDPDIVKLVITHDQQAIYFSRASIPFVRDEVINEHSQLPLYRHVGLYAYRTCYLKKFVSYPPTALEKLERLEQLRAIQHGDLIITQECKAPPGIGVDTHADFSRLLVNN